MLKPGRTRIAMARAQQGLVMIVALLVLVVLTVAALGLMGSVDSTTMLAGNLAFKKAATRAGDAGTEAAIQVIQSLSLAQRNADQPASGYFASIGAADSPGGAGGATWAQVWQNRFAGSAVTFPAGNGNQVSYVIHRECAFALAPGSGGTCVTSPAVLKLDPGGNLGLDPPPFWVSTQIYYRITVRIVGPRRTESYVQTHVAL